MYIHDYLVKRDLKASAQAFQAEGKVSSDPVGRCMKLLFRGKDAHKSIRIFYFFSNCAFDCWFGFEFWP